MFYDLHSLFEFQINSDTSYLLTKDFEDGIIENKNARILYDKEGKIALTYVFADENSVVIGRSVPMVRELISRLSSAKVKQ